MKMTTSSKLTSNFRVLKGAAKNIPEKAIVLSRKAQLFLMYHGDNMDELIRMAQLRDNYLARRNTESINRITAAEIENCIRYGLQLDAHRQRQRRKDG